jgi:hypothetical protein
VDNTCERGAAEQNTLYSNTLINSNGQRINLDQQQKQEEQTTTADDDEEE